jgi:hypothetical protein
VDYSRKKVVFKDSEGKKISDPNMDKISKRFFNSINDRNKELTYKYLKDITKNMSDKDGVELSIDVMSRLCDVECTSKGISNKLGIKFVDKICNRSIPYE